jgi:indole-3-glycerol phosphate synthase
MRDPFAGTREAGIPLDELKKRALARPAPRAALHALRGDHITVIAELDPAHPARAELTEKYEHCGVAAIAVPARSGASAGVGAGVCVGADAAADAGSLDKMAEISARIQTPVLCMDPATSSYQIWQARAYGADLVLLPATLPREALLSLVERAGSIGLTAIIDVCDAQDLVRALRAHARAVLLRPRHPDPTAAREALHGLLAMVPDRVVRVAECGPAGRSDLIACARLGADAVLLSRAALVDRDPGATVADLTAIGAHPSLFRRREQTV